MLRALVVQLAVINILLQRHRPRDVVDLRHVVSVRLQCPEELVEPQSWVPCDMRHADGLARRMECTGDDHSRNMIDWNHVDSVVDVGTGGQLDTSLDHSDEEVIGVGRW